MARTRQQPEEAPPPGAAPGFDERLARLELIVGELENGGLSLEAAIERYQEGVGLLRECRTQLAGYEKRVEELSESGALTPMAGEREDPERA